jgi:hypothetical protein
MHQASAWIDEMQSLAARSGMRELTVRSAARLLACEIDYPALRAAIEL